METRFTPGPWDCHDGKFKGNEPVELWIFSADHVHIGTVISGWDDAHLIAAAPDLYAALKEARTDLMLAAGNMDTAAKTDPRWEGCGDILRKRIKECDAALARARGEEVSGG